MITDFQRLFDAVDKMGINFNYAGDETDLRFLIDDYEIIFTFDLDGKSTGREITRV